MWEVTTTVDVSSAMGVECVGQLEVFAPGGGHQDAKVVGTADSFQPWRVHSTGSRGRIRFLV